MKSYQLLLICLALWQLVDFSQNTKTSSIPPESNITERKAAADSLWEERNGVKDRECYMFSPAYYKDHPPCAKFSGGGHSGYIPNSWHIWGLYAPCPPDFENEINSEVFSYRVMLKRDHRVIGRFFNKGGFLNEKLRAFIRDNVAKNDTLVFYDIQYQLLNGKFITLPSLKWVEKKMPNQWQMQKEFNSQSPY